MLAQMFLDQDGHGVDLFAGSTACVPDAHRILGVPPIEQTGNDLVPQNLERLRIAEEAGHTDQNVLAECLSLLRVLLDQCDILSDAAYFVYRHATLDAAHDGVRLVGAEIMTGLAFYDTEDGAQFVVEGGYPARVVREDTIPPGDLGDLGSYFLRGKDKVRRAGGYRAFGHGVVDGRGGLLYQNRPTGIFDRLDSGGAVDAET